MSRREGDHTRSTTGSSRASAPGSTLAATKTRRPLRSAISILASGFEGQGAVDADGGVWAESVSGINAGGRPAPRSPFRNFRRQTVSSERETP